MKVLPHIRSAVSSVGRSIAQIRLYRTFAQQTDLDALPIHARRRLGLSD